MLDLNQNGIDDRDEVAHLLKEPAVWRIAGGLICGLVKSLAKPYTIAYRAADAFQRTLDDQRQRLEPTPQPPQRPTP